MNSRTALAQFLQVAHRLSTSAPPFPASPRPRVLASLGRSRRPRYASVPKSVLLLALGLAATIGCMQPERSTPEQLSHGLLLMIPGIEGSPSQFVNTCRGLREAGVDCAIEIHDWNQGPLGSLVNLTDLKGNRRRAASIAAQLADYREQYPNGPVTLIGYSGGGALALFTCEALPDDVMLDRVIVMAAGISPGYDLGPTLAHVRRGVVNFYSKGDWWTLGVYTNLFGTLDRVKAPAAGHVAFCEADGDYLMCPGLTQVRWIPSWRRLGHGGGHLGWLARDWAREVLAPQIRTTSSHTRAQPAPTAIAGSR